MSKNLQNLESFVKVRSFLFANVPIFLSNLQARREDKKNHSDDLFGALEEDSQDSKVAWLKDYDLRSRFQILAEEKDSLGLYVSGNPLTEYTDLLDYLKKVTYLEDQLHLVLIEKMRKIFTRKGGMMLALEITTPYEQLEGLIFPKRAPKFSSMLEEKNLYWVLGKISKKEKKQEAKTDDSEIAEYDELPKLLIDSVSPFTVGIQGMLSEAEIFLPDQRKNLIKEVKWSEIQKNPKLFSKQMDGKDEQKIVTKTLKLPRSLGTAKLKEIQAKLRTTPQKGDYKLKLQLETSTGWKQSRKTFYLDPNTFDSIEQA